MSGWIRMNPELSDLVVSFMTIDEKLRVKIKPKRMRHASADIVLRKQDAGQVGYAAWQVVLPIGDTKCLSIMVCKDVIMCIFNTTTILHHSDGDAILYGFMIEDSSTHFASICIQSFS